MTRRDFRDPRLLLLSTALLLALLALVAPRASVKRASFDLLVVVDITGSMNTRDYSAEGHPISRLEFVKTTLVEMIANLPCASRVALAVFSERRPFLLFEPIETCANYAPLEAAIRALDWRMAWEGDSRIAAGLFHAVEMARQLKADLLFLTDGQEAPPLPPSGPPPFEGHPGEQRGLIVGVGGANCPRSRNTTITDAKSVFTESRMFRTTTASVSRRPARRCAKATMRVTRLLAPRSRSASNIFRPCEKPICDPSPKRLG